jgi:hypothetical protein
MAGFVERRERFVERNERFERNERLVEMESFTNGPSGHHGWAS